MVHVDNKVGSKEEARLLMEHEQMLVSRSTSFFLHQHDDPRLRRGDAACCNFDRRTILFRRQRRFLAAQPEKLQTLASRSGICCCESACNHGLFGCAGASLARRVELGAPGLATKGTLLPAHLLIKDDLMQKEETKYKICPNTSEIIPGRASEATAYHLQSGRQQGPGQFSSGGALS